MAVPFIDIQRHLEKYQLQPNQAPPPLVHGVLHYPIDLGDQFFCFHYKHRGSVDISSVM